MTQSRKKTSSAMADWTSAFWSAAASAQAASVTIALRAPIMVQAALDPFAAKARQEAIRAGAEKWEAGVEGATAAMQESAALWMRVFTRPGDLDAWSAGMHRVARAATRPAYARVKGNAKRLTRS